MRGSSLGLAVVGLVMLCAVAWPGCGPGVRHLQLGNPTLRANGDTEQEHDGIRIVVEPVTWGNAVQQPDVFRRIPVHTPRGVGTASGPILPVPAFRVTITNGTGHVVRMTQSVIRLTDHMGHQMRVMTTTQIAAAAETAWAEPIAQDPAVRNQLTGMLSQMEFLTNESELLNGDVTPFYLVFNLPEQPGEDGYRQFMDAIGGRLTLRIAEVPVELGDAGQVTRSTEFEFNFDTDVYMESVECPGRGEATWQTCHRRSPTSGR
jgi:hypothetical protein